MQTPAQIRALQIGVAVGGGAVQQQRRQLALLQRLAQGRVVERQVHGVARLGVGELEIQLGAGRQAGARAAQGDTRRAPAAQLLPRVRRSGGLFAHDGLD